MVRPGVRIVDHHESLIITIPSSLKFIRPRFTNLAILDEQDQP
jgi:hypothetical protein